MISANVMGSKIPRTESVQFICISIIHCLYTINSSTLDVAIIASVCGLPNPRLNPLNPELNPICYLLILLGAHRFLHVSRIRVKLLTFRRLMSHTHTHTHIYIYIYIHTHTHMEHPFLMFLDHTQRRSTVGRTPLDE